MCMREYQNLGTAKLRHYTIQYLQKGHIALGHCLLRLEIHFGESPNQTVVGTKYKCLITPNVVSVNNLQCSYNLNRIFLIGLNIHK